MVKHGTALEAKNFARIHVTKTPAGQWFVDFSSLGRAGFTELVPLLESYQDVIRIDYQRMSITCTASEAQDHRYWLLQTQLMLIYASLLPVEKRQLLHAHLSRLP